MKKSVLICLLSIFMVLGAWAVQSPKARPKEVRVTNTTQFLKAIAPNTTIIIDIIEIDPIIFSEYYSEAISPYCNFEYAFDGQQLVIHDVQGLTIQGPEELPARILTPYSYANVIVFRDCEDISLRWLNCGHDIEGYCTGGVIYLENCHGVEIKNCDLWGCGIDGLTITGCSDVDVSYTTIRDCSYSIMSIYDSQDISFQYCLMHDNREYDLLNFTNSKRVSFEDCVIWNNTSGGYYSGGNLLRSSGSDILFDRCAIFNNSVEYLTNEEAVVRFEDCIMFGNRTRNMDW